MKKHIYDESNGLSYTLHGDYYLPDLAVNEEEPTYGKYGMLRKQFLKVHRPARYQYVLMTGELTGHLNQVDQEAGCNPDLEHLLADHSYPHSSFLAAG